MSLSINYRRLYLAYGANSNMSNMSLRCPRAIPVGTYLLSGYEMVFQGVANVRARKRSKTHCVLWDITRECEQSLDRYEEYPRVYGKCYIRSRRYGRTLMFYALRFPLLRKYPAESYISCIAAGYKTFGISERQFEYALDRSYAGGQNRTSVQQYDYKI